MPTFHVGETWVFRLPSALAPLPLKVHKEKQDQSMIVPVMCAWVPVHALDKKNTFVAIALIQESTIVRINIHKCTNNQCTQTSLCV